MQRMMTHLPVNVDAIKPVLPKKGHERSNKALATLGLRHHGAESIHCAGVCVEGVPANAEQRLDGGVLCPHVLVEAKVARAVLVLWLASNGVVR